MKLKEQLLRWTLIVRKIQKYPGISPAELQREVMLELSFRGYDSVCSESTLKRDLKELREEFDLEIEFNRSLKGYELKRMKKNWLDVDCIIEPLEMITAFDDKEKPEWLFTEKYSPIGTQHLSVIIKAIKQLRKIEFIYRKYSDGSTSHRHISPYAIKQWKGRWYVIGTENDGSMKTFGMDRMEQLYVTNETFVKDKSYDIENKFKYSFGIYSSTEYPIKDVILSCDKEDGNYLKSRPLHQSQEVLEENDNGMTFKLRVRITPDFVMEIISRSWSVKVLQPKSLRKQICDIYTKALERNAKPIVIRIKS